MIPGRLLSAADRNSSKSSEGKREQILPLQASSSSFFFSAAATSRSCSGGDRRNEEEHQRKNDRMCVQTKKKKETEAVGTKTQNGRTWKQDTYVSMKKKNHQKIKRRIPDKTLCRAMRH